MSDADDQLGGTEAFSEEEELDRPPGRSGADAAGDEPDEPDEPGQDDEGAPGSGR